MIKPRSLKQRKAAREMKPPPNKSAMKEAVKHKISPSRQNC
ncbi:hypothetical protein BH20ACI4_BH20ACI4_13390 [soil metagenome]